jgi:hypothetical protein
MTTKNRMAGMPIALFLAKRISSASAAVQNMSDAELTAVISDGKAKMPAYGQSLKRDRVKDLVAYI